MTFDIAQIALGAVLAVCVVAGEVSRHRLGDPVTLEDGLFSTFLIVCALVLVLGGATA